MELLDRHSWILLVIGMIAMGQSWFSRAQALTRVNPELGPGYRRLYVGSIIAFSVPWLLAGVGVVSGQISSMTDLLRPIAATSFVLLWWACLAGLFGLGTYWICLAGGAEMLAKHPGVFMVPHWSAPKLKLFWLGLVAWNGAFAALAFSGALHPRPLGWFVVLAPIAFPALWICVGHLTAALGGWNVLAERYRATTDFNGTRLHFRSVSFGYVNYASCLTIGSDAQDLYLAVRPLFRVGHPPLLIPWSDVRTHEVRTWLSAAVDFTFAQAPTVSVRMRKQLADKVMKNQGV